MSQKKIILSHRFAMGDTILMTALVRDIHRAYPGKYLVGVDTHFTNVWWGNPHITAFDAAEKPSIRSVAVRWGGAWKSASKIAVKGKLHNLHILGWYHHNFEQKTGIHVPVTDPRPELFFLPKEVPRIVSGRYWVVLAGGKLDMTVKHWRIDRWQQVVNALREKGLNFVQVGAAHTHHIHPPLQGVVNLVGRLEDVRGLWNVIKYSEGVICGVTGAMHIAAALEKPCVVVAGGREDPWFEAYTNEYKAFGASATPVNVPHRFLHSLGKLDCCRVKGCWKKLTVPLDAADRRKPDMLCKRPIVRDTPNPLPECNNLITTEQVVEAVMSYYADGTLPPVSLNSDLDSSVEIAEEPVREIQEPVTPPRIQKPAQQHFPKQAATASKAVDVRQNLMDNPVIGGKFTVCILCYGNYPALARKCISSLLQSLPENRLDLRIAANKVSPETMAYLQSVPATKIYEQKENAYKYPVMRRMFYDEEYPLKTNYLLWLDDDTWVANPKWASDLALTIISSHSQGYGMYGAPYHHNIANYRKKGNNPATWFREANWYKGISFKSRGNGPESPNGSIIDFAVGWCWAASVEALRKADIPDKRLQHNGGDITIGEQMHQAGFKIKPWNKGKSLIACPSREAGGRRGYSETFPWAGPVTVLTKG